MKHTLTEHDAPGWYECTDKFSRRVIRFWTGQVLKNFPDAAWHWSVTYCHSFVGPLLPLDQLRQAFAICREEFVAALNTSPVTAAAESKTKPVKGVSK